MKETKNKPIKRVLSEAELLDFIKSGRLVITPLLDNKQINRASIDVRLGNEFIVMKQTALSGLDVKEYEKLGQEIRQYQDKIRIRFKEPFVLHPQQFVLGSTLEYISLPRNLIAYVIGRSSWGRLGLVIATATFVDPGFKGTITLELVNLGSVPITLYPCVRIAQLVFHKLDKKVEPYSGKYEISTGPQFSKVYADNELSWLVPKEQA
ncbi:MAG: dCTP deaminase [Nitrospirota bacterium]